MAGSTLTPRPTRYCESTGRAARPVRMTAARSGVDGRSRRGRPSVQPQPAMRLTRRGRVLLVVLASVLLLVVFSLGRASSHATGARAIQTRTTVVVQPGETLWQFAKRVAPKADPRITVDRIIKLNDLQSADLIRPGQQIVLPG